MKARHARFARGSPSEYFPAFLRDRLGSEGLEPLEEATRFTVDSQLGRFIRLLVAALEKTVDLNRIPDDLVSLDVWGEEREQFLAREEAASRLRVRPERLTEGRVFIEALGYVIDFTDEAGQRTKRGYTQLLSREGIPPGALGRQAR